jgi:hypothetical protein
MPWIHIGNVEVKLQAFYTSTLDRGKLHDPARDRALMGWRLVSDRDDLDSGSEQRNPVLAGHPARNQSLPVEIRTGNLQNAKQEDDHYIAT